MGYNELVKALRCIELRLSCNECKYGKWSESGEAWSCEFERRDADAADAIEALQAQLPKQGKYVHGRELSREYIGDCLVSIDYEDWRCSICGIVFEQWSIPKYNYCPNCGAKMEAQDGK